MPPTGPSTGTTDPQPFRNIATPPQHQTVRNPESTARESPLARPMSRHLKPAGHCMEYGAGRVSTGPQTARTGPQTAPSTRPQTGPSPRPPTDWIADRITDRTSTDRTTDRTTGPSTGQTGTTHRADRTTDRTTGRQTGPTKSPTGSPTRSMNSMILQSNYLCQIKRRPDGLNLGRTICQARTRGKKYVFWNAPPAPALRTRKGSDLHNQPRFWSTCLLNIWIINL